MRYRELFTVFPRKMKSGRIVWYYQTYDDEGNRTIARSTGQTSKGAARVYCNKLYKEDALIPNKGDNVLFEDYAKNWWIWDKCEYVKFRRSRRELSRNYVETGRINLHGHILPYFKKMKLKDIKASQIEKWLTGFASEGLSNSTANNHLVNLNIMLKEAIRRGLIKSNPAENIRALKSDGKTRDILSINEVSRIFDYKNIEKIWNGKVFYLANLLSACTGLRACEVLAVRKEVLFDGYILVDRQYHYKYGLQDTKTHDSREVPIPKEIQDELELLKEQYTGEYLFSVNGGITPVRSIVLNNHFKRALHEIGISKEEQKRRSLCFHGWRHFFNTTMRTNNISDGKLKKLTGHKSQIMTEHYTHFKADDFQDVKQIQNKILQMPQKAG